MLHLKKTPFSQAAGTLGRRTVSVENRQPAEATALVRAPPLGRVPAAERSVSGRRDAGHSVPKGFARVTEPAGQRRGAGSDQSPLPGAGASQCPAEGFV